MRRIRRLFLWIALTVLLVPLATLLFAHHIGVDTYELRRYLVRENRDVYRAIRKAIKENDSDIIRAAGIDTPELRLVLSRKDVAHFADLYQKYKDPEFGVEYYSKTNQWRKADLIFEDRTYPIRLRVHGKKPTGHRVGKYISYAVKMPKGENLLGYRRFSLIVRNRIQSNRHVIRHISDYFDLIYHDLELVKVKINSWDTKLYYLQPRFDDDFFEAKGMASLRTFKRSVSDTESSFKSMVNVTGRNDSLFSPDVYRNDFLRLLGETDYTEDQKEEIIARHNKLNDAIMSNDYENVLQYVDLDYIASFEAFRTVVGASVHGFASEDNFHIAYNFSNGKFYPIVTDDIFWTKLDLEDGQTVEGALDTINSKSKFFGPFDDNEAVQVIRFLNLLSQNDRIRNKKYELIHRAALEVDEIGEKHDEIMAKYDGLHCFGLVKMNLRNFGMSGFPIHTGNNLGVLQLYLEEANPEIRVTNFQDGFSISIVPNSMAGLSISSLTFAEPPADPNSQENAETSIAVTEFREESQKRVFETKVRQVPEGGDYASLLEKVIMSDTVDDASNRVGRRYQLDVQFSGSSSVTDDQPKIQVAQALTKQALPAQVNYTSSDQTVSVVTAAMLPKDAMLPRDALIGQLQQYKTVLDFTVSGDQFVIQPGTYEIDEDIILPDGLKLVLEPGTTLLLGGGVLLMGRDGIEVRGTKAHPVVIDAKNPAEPFGAIGILGSSQTTSVINYLSLRNGYERLAEGVYFSGALSIYFHKSVAIHNSTIANNHADDGLNIKYADDVVLQNTHFRDNFADQVDLDYCHALVLDSRFENETGDSNGDGLDISGSEAIVYRNEFANLKDKGVSIGENSRVYLVSNQLTGNHMGIAVKDSSSSYVLGNQYDDNLVDVALYKKKKIWSGATLYLLQVGNQLVDLRFEKDKNSEVVQQDVAEHVVREFLANLDSAASSDQQGMLAAVKDNLDFARSVFGGSVGQ